MNGLEVAKEIVSINPHQRIIIASAYDKEIFEEAADYFGLPLEILQKPFSNEELNDLLEDKTLYQKLESQLINVEPLKKAKLRHEQLKKIEKLLNKQEEDGKIKKIQVNESKLDQRVKIGL